MNPNFGCGLQDEFDYGEREMRAEIEGTWKATGTFDGAPVALTLSLRQATAAEVEQRPLISPYCESRSFVRPAGACSSRSEMPIVGMVLDGPTAWKGQKVAGKFSMFYRRAAGGAIEATWGEPKVELRGSWSSLRASTLSEGARTGQITLERVATAP